MLVSDFIQEVNDALRGTDDDVPLSGTPDYEYWLRTANRLRRTLYKDVSKFWASTYSVLSLGTVTVSATPSYNLSATYLGAANEPYIITTDGNRHNLELIKPQERNPNRREVFIAGQNPQTLKFTDEIVTGEQIVGGTLYLPGYFMPADFDSDDDTVVVDDVDWLILATAAKIAFNDLTYEDKYPDLQAESTALYKQMTRNNRRGVYGDPIVTPTDVQRITSPDRN